MNVVKTYPSLPGSGIRSFYSVQAHYTSSNARLPDGTLDVVFNLGAPVLYSSDGVSFTPMPDAALTGLYTRRKFITFTGELHLVGVVFEPGFAHCFINDSLHHYPDCAIDASLVFGSSINRLHQQLAAEAGERERHSLLERHFNSYPHKRKQEHQSAIIAAAAKHIQTAQGNVDVTAMHRNYYMSERNFRRRFTEFVGIAPKQYSRITRVKAFSKSFETQRGAYNNLFTVLGYNDPAHFTKDFTNIAGTSPSSYFRGLDALGSEFIHLI